MGHCINNDLILQEAGLDLRFRKQFLMRDSTLLSFLVLPYVIR